MIRTYDVDLNIYAVHYWTNLLEILQQLVVVYIWGELILAGVKGTLLFCCFVSAINNCN